MSEQNTVSVLAGQQREKVGEMPLALKMLTNHGVVTRITPKGTVFVRPEGGADNEEQQLKGNAKLSVRLTEARKFGYPDAKGCKRLKEVRLRRKDQVIVS